jgi:hypothetical protein
VQKIKGCSTLSQVNDLETDSHHLMRSHLQRKKAQEASETLTCKRETRALVCSSRKDAVKKTKEPPQLPSAEEEKYSGDSIRKKTITEKNTKKQFLKKKTT